MLFFFDLCGIVVFAITGCLLAARRGLDLVGFIWLAIITAVGGGTLRDLILERPVFWRDQPIYLYLCLATACFMYVMAHWIHRHLRWVLWCDAAGIALFAVIGTQISLSSGTAPIVALGMGILTATFGGILRDLLAGETTLIMRREIYVTAAALSSALYLIGTLVLHQPDSVIVPIAILAGFSLRAFALHYRLHLPGHRWLGDFNDKSPIPDRRREN